MLNLLKLLADRYLTRYALIVGNDNVQCGRCHFWADPAERRHTSVPRAEIFPGKTGCGARWFLVTKRYRGGLPWPAPGEADRLDLINRERKRLGRPRLVRIDIMPAPSPGYYAPPTIPAWQHRLYNWSRKLLYRLRLTH